MGWLVSQRGNGTGLTDQGGKPGNVATLCLLDHRFSEEVGKEETEFGFILANHKYFFEICRLINSASNYVMAIYEIFGCIFFGACNIVVSRENFGKQSLLRFETIEVRWLCDAMIGVSKMNERRARNESLPVGEFEP
ncbi:hypothetical protein V5E97_25155 [Singulisphaera sp. Ch08]|uniref:Uncharacterized protein n=1 Tax=Singulisphaera sp. Ch08 TaxID=3120278 RepID=A0AAU7C8L0_9BACT